LGPRILTPCLALSSPFASFAALAPTGGCPFLCLGWRPLILGGLPPRRLGGLDQRQGGRRLRGPRGRGRRRRCRGIGFAPFALGGAVHHLEAGQLGRELAFWATHHKTPRDAGGRRPARIEVTLRRQAIGRVAAWGGHGNPWSTVGFECAVADSKMQRAGAGHQAKAPRGLSLPRPGQGATGSTPVSSKQ